MHYSSVDLTRELLHCGAFSHLPDRDLARLQWIILQGQAPGERVSLESFIPFWYKGNFYLSHTSQRLLQRCNEFLQSIGQPLIEGCCVESMEA